MKLNPSTLFLAVVCTLLASCYPYPEVPPHTGAGPNPNQRTTTTSSPDQQKIEAERERMRLADEAKKKEAEQKKNEVATKPTTPTTPPTPSNTTKPTVPKPTEPKPRTDWPFATPVPGKEGLVFSPYNQKIVDVRGMPSGSLVTDPTYPPDEKKFFRVP